MNDLCSPYSGTSSLSSYCIGSLLLPGIDSLFFFSLILIESLLAQAKKFSKPSSVILASIIFQIFCNFICLTLVLFYLPASQVSLAEVLASGIQVLCWIMVFNSYYKYYSPYESCKTRLWSLKLFAVSRTIYLIYSFVLIFLVSPDKSKQNFIMWVRLGC